MILQQAVFLSYMLLHDGIQEGMKDVFYINKLTLKYLITMSTKKQRLIKWSKTAQKDDICVSFLRYCMKHNEG